MNRSAIYLAHFFLSLYIQSHHYADCIFLPLNFISQMLEDQIKAESKPPLGGGKSVRKNSAVFWPLLVVWIFTTHITGLMRRSGRRSDRKWVYQGMDWSELFKKSKLPDITSMSSISLYGTFSVFLSLAALLLCLDYNSQPSWRNGGYEFCDMWSQAFWGWGISLGYSDITL